jgi:hypothetical protein
MIGNYVWPGAFGGFGMLALIALMEAASQAWGHMRV